jgi:hypothetical protein
MMNLSLRLWPQESPDLKHLETPIIPSNHVSELLHVLYYSVYDSEFNECLLHAQVVEDDSLEDLVEGDTFQGEALEVSQLLQVGAELHIGLLAAEGHVAQTHLREAGGGCLEEAGEVGVRLVIVREQV